MARVKHPGRLARLLIAGLLAVIPLQDAAARNLVKIDMGDVGTIMIIIPIDVVGANKHVIERWDAAISEHWNNGPDGKPFRWCGMEVIIIPDIHSVPEGQEEADRHTVQAERLRPGQKFIPTVRADAPDIVSGTEQWHYYGRRGQWGGPGYDTLIAHEAGHFLGLGDEYIWDPDKHDLNGNGKRDPGEPTEPDTANFPDAKESIMAWGKGRVLQRHIDEIILQHDIDEELECTLKIRHEGELSWDGTYGQHTDVGRSFVAFEIEIEQADSGQLHGQGRAVALEHEREAHVTTERCLWGKQTLSESASIPDFEVNGTRNGNTVSLTLPENLDANFLADFENQCAGITDVLNLKLRYLHEIEGELENDRFEETTVEEIPRPNWIPLTVRYYVLIEEQAKPKKPPVG